MLVKEFDLSELDLKSGIHHINIVAKSNEYAPKSINIEYYVSELPPPSITIEDGILTIQADTTRVKFFDVYSNINGKVASIPSSSSTVNLNELNLNYVNHDITVRSVSSRYEASKESNHAWFLNTFRELAYPTYTISDGIISIVPAEDSRVSGYIISVFDNIVARTNNTTFDLGTLNLPIGHHIISIVATDDKGHFSKENRQEYVIYKVTNLKAGWLNESNEFVECVYEEGTEYEAPTVFEVTYDGTSESDRHSSVFEITDEWTSNIDDSNLVGKYGSVVGTIKYDSMLTTYRAGLKVIDDESYLLYMNLEDPFDYESVNKKWGRSGNPLLV